jgi:hypothetical protein
VGVALVVGGLALGCTEGNPANKPEPGNTGSGDVASFIVGAWEMPEMITGDDPDDYRMLIDVRPSGEVVGYEFMRVGDGWIETVSGVDDEQLRWRADGKRLYISADGEEGGSVPYRISNGVLSVDTTIPGMNITISGNKLNVEVCEGRVCVPITITKTTIAAARNSLGGQIYTKNPALRGDWVMEGDDDEHLYLGSSWFDYRGDRYFSDNDNYYTSGMWYTNGNRLYLVEMDWVCDNDWDNCKDVVVSTLDLSYSVTGSGSNRRLTIGGDAWVLDDDNYYGDRALAKSKSLKLLKSLKSLKPLKS